jgi:hypothetical protein
VLSIFDFRVRLIIFILFVLRIWNSRRGSKIENHPVPPALRVVGDSKAIVTANGGL